MSKTPTTVRCGIPACEATETTVKVNGAYPDKPPGWTDVQLWARPAITKTLCPTHTAAVIRMLT